ncbi:ral guanine nucleotide dissociation stimulator-like 3 isoform X2 [Mustela lutreola]|uniref:ral guanine nucleotide dissociation stimulator-like 3 isoform X2 n=1 Tax=Mustela lutreola TaxID=9666 RepID=UPI0027972686|nr:ral guanine nucleotide dissociation stimulator-like 3 isoform X2 [Mustela lutreola]
MHRRVAPPCPAGPNAQPLPDAHRPFRLTQPRRGVGRPQVMDRTAGKELALAPVQDWGEEAEDGAVYSVSLRRQLSQRLSPRAAPGASQASNPAADAFLHYRTSKVRALRAARLERLVQELVSGDREQDPGFVPAFLATHRAFASTARVLGLLLPPPPPPLPPGTEIKKTEGGGLRVNKNLRAVVSVLGSWLRDHPQDFRDPPAHSDLGSVRTFLGWAAPAGPEAQEAEKLLGAFLEEAKQKQEEEEKPEAWTGPPGAVHSPRPDSPEDCSEPEAEAGPMREGPELLDFSVDELAEQLTLLDVELFARVRSCECLGSVWSQRDRPGAASTAPTVRATVTQFNLVTGCVLGSVLGEQGLASPQRAQRLEKWIRVAQRCRELRNFSSLRAILSALQSNPIYRLKRSWGAVSRERLSTFRKLSQIFSDENNHLSSREILSQEEAIEGPQEEDTLPGNLPPKLPPGPVPYLGTFLTDLVMLDTALPDMLEGDLINFEKRRKQLQKRCGSYCLSPRAPVLAALRAQCQLSEEQSYRVSRVIEPPAASCPSSPHVRRRISPTKRLSAKLSRERRSSPAGSPGDPSSPTPSLSPGSPPSSPRTRDPPGSPPASPGPQGPNTKLPLSLDLPALRLLALPLSSSHISVLGQPGSEARVIRVSIDNDHGNLYRSILLTSQDKAPSVVQRALEKHNVAQPWARDYQLFQVLPGDRELLIPDNANVFYAMSPAAPGDFVLRRKEGARPTTTISSS